MISDESRRQLDRIFTQLRKCGVHDPQWVPAEVLDIICWSEPEPWGIWDAVTIIVVQLTTGFGVLTSMADYTGHGCRCHELTAREASLVRVLGHLTERELKAVLG